MSIQLDAWTAFKTAITSSTLLTSYVKTFKFYGATFQSAQTDLLPMLVCWPRAIPNDQWFAMPKRKLVKMEVLLQGIIFQNFDAIANELISFDELIKNAAESDIRLGGKAIITAAESSTFHFLDENVGLVQIPVKITMPILTAGNR